MSAPKLYLLSGAALDRRAYCQLLRGDTRVSVALDSNFEAVNVWKSLREKPTHAIVVAAAPELAVRDTLHMFAKLAPDLRVLVISSAFEPDQLRHWAACAFHGYLVKDAEPEELGAAVQALLRGEAYHSPGVAGALEQFRRRDSADRPKLSRRESELLPLLARGLSLRDAALEMTVSYKTADSYRTSLMRKIGVRDRVELSRYAIRGGIIEA